jgi:hypothetical protein
MSRNENNIWFAGAAHKYSSVATVERIALLAPFYPGVVLWDIDALPSELEKQNIQWTSAQQETPPIGSATDTNRNIHGPTSTYKHSGSLTVMAVNSSSRLGNLSTFSRLLSVCDFDQPRK